MKMMLITSRSSISSYLCACYMVISKNWNVNRQNVFFCIILIYLLSLNYKIWWVKKPVVRKHNYFLSVFLFFLPKPLMEFHSKSNTIRTFSFLFEIFVDIIMRFRVYRLKGWEFDMYTRMICPLIPHEKFHVLIEH